MHTKGITIIDIKSYIKDIDGLAGFTNTIECPHSNIKLPPNQGQNEYPAKMKPLTYR